MTFRAKPVAKRPQRPSWDHGERRNLYMNIGFGVVVVAAVLILVIASGLTWYDQHLSSVGSVNGSSITKDDYIARFSIETWRLNKAERDGRTEHTAGHLTDGQASSLQSLIDQERQNLESITLERLIDTKLQATLASAQGITVTDADIDAKLVGEATTPESRHVFVIEVTPVKDTGAADPTTAQIATAKAKADQALADLTAGKAWDEIAKVVSTDASTAPQAGDLGWIRSGDSQTDPGLLTAVFAAQPNTPTAVILGADGTFRIGRVTEIAPQTVDPAYQQTITNDGVDLAKYRAVVAGDLIHDKLQAKIIADAIQPGPQRQVSEIFIRASQSTVPADAIKVRHILYSPKHDAQGASAIPATDPSWATAQQEAQATYAKLQADPTQFDQIARAESDESQARGVTGTGGKLQWIDPTSPVDAAFLAAVTKPGLVAGQLLPPVKSPFGWHVIQVMYRPTDALEIAALGTQAEAGGDFATLARNFSDDASAGKGGDLGWVAKGQIDDSLTKAIYGATVGGVTPVVTLTAGNTSTDGVYLFKVVAEQTRTPDGTQLDAIKKNAFPAWYAAQKSAATIVRDPALAANQ